MYKILLILAFLLTSCADFEIVNNDSKVSVIKHLNKIQVYDYDKLVFQTKCWVKTYMDMHDSNVYIKVVDEVTSFNWSEIYQFELTGHHYSFKKVRCD